jgi:hypothetical protein
MFWGMFYPVNPVPKMQVPIHFHYIPFGKSCKGKKERLAGRKKVKSAKGKGKKAAFKRVAYGDCLIVPLWFLAKARMGALHNDFLIDSSAVLGMTERRLRPIRVNNLRLSPVILKKVCEFSEPISIVAVIQKCVVVLLLLRGSKTVKAGTILL